MKMRLLNVPVAVLVAFTQSVLMAATAQGVLAADMAIPPATASQQVSAISAVGRTSQSFSVHGTTVTNQQLRARQEPTMGAPRETSPRRASSLLPRPASAPTAGSSPRVSSSRNSPQIFADEIIGPQITDTAGFVPPDTMGAVGPTQFLFSVNGRFRGYNKNSPHTQIFDFAEATFWGSTADPAGVSDAHVRYDRSSGRWFMIEIDVKASANHILLAVSSTADLSTTAWTLFQIPATGSTSPTDMGCFDDYPTPGIDGNGIYIGGNIFGGGVVGCPGGNYLHSNLYVIQKSSALTSTVNVTPFFNVVTGVFNIETIQGVDSVGSLATGYAVAAKETESPTQHLSIWQINNPGTTTPTLSGPTDVAISAENGVLGGGGVGVVSKNNALSPDPTRGMDDLDDRLFAATIRFGHLWTAHNVAVDSSGNSNGGARTRDAARWYDVTLSGPTLNQSGTIFDSMASGFQNFWMPSIMVSGQGHVAMGLNEANATTLVQAGALGRLAGDPLGTMGAFGSFQTSASALYDDAGFNPNPTNRWGDYTYTSLDPCDDQTMWTAQEYVAGSANVVDWGVAAEKLLAPPPATPSSASPGSVNVQETNLNVVITGTSASGSGFFETPAGLTDPCRKHITAAVSGGVTVNSIQYTDPTHVTLNINTTGATIGSHTVTITNPDGQAASAAILTTGAAATLSESPSTVSPGASVTATWGGIVNPSGGDWIGLYATGAPDTAALSFHHTNGAASGSLSYNMGGVSPGTYELRLFYNNTLARLATSGTITVQGASLSASPSTVGPGASPTVTWSGIATPTSGDWIGFYAAGAPDNSALSFRYTGGAASGSLSYNVGSVSPGMYEFRLFANNSLSRLATSGAITVQGANLSASPSTVAPGGSVTATWSGIATPTSGDWIGFYAAGAPDTSALSFRYTGGAASGSLSYNVGGVSPGTFELRLFANNSLSRLATSGAITVQGASLSASPSTVMHGNSVTVTWSGIATPTSGDWIGLYAVGAPDNSALSFRYTGGAASGSLSYNVGPVSPGMYEFRLFANNSLSRMATSGTITVT